MSGLILAIDVPGVPVPQGSMKHIGRGRVIHSNATALAAWRGEIIQRAAAQIEDRADGAVEAWFEFRVPRPKSVKRLLPIGRRDGDADKLARAVNDALTMAGVWLDDSQVVDLHITQRYATDDAPPGVGIRITAY